MLDTSRNKSGRAGGLIYRNGDKEKLEGTAVICVFRFCVTDFVLLLEVSYCAYSLLMSAVDVPAA